MGPLELFFDLVFVFAITQVTAYIAKDPTWETLARGLLILAVVWWAWVAYSWLTNTLDTERDDVRLVMFVAMGAMFVVSLSIPHAFSDDALLFAAAYLVVRAAHILLYGYASNDTGVQQAVRRLALVVALIALALIPVAMEVDALITVVLLATLLSALIVYEVIHFREARERVRAAAHTG